MLNTAGGWQNKNFFSMVLTEDSKYGKIGDTVVVISYRGSVAIVENLAGNRFAVRAAILTTNPNKNEIPKIIEQLDKELPKNICRKKTNKSNGGSGISASPSLFD